MSEALEIKQQPVQQVVKAPSISKAEYKALYATDASPAQFEVFLKACHTYGLTPIKNEIMCSKHYGNKPYITKIGCFAVANRHPQFDGIVSGIVYEGDELTRRTNESYVLIPGPDHFKKTTKDVKGAYCNVYRKDRSIATAVYENLATSRGIGPKWNTQPDAMILKTAEMHAIQKAFELDLDVDIE